MTRVVVERAAAFALGRAPRRALAAQDDRAVRLGADVVDGAERARSDEPRRLAERADEAVVVADLRHALLAARERDETLAVGDVEDERLLAEDVEAARKRLLDHRGVQLRGRRDDQRVELLGVEHAVEIGVALETRVLRENVGQIGGRVAAGDEIDLRVCARDREVREPHLAEADHPGPEHSAGHCGAVGRSSGGDCHDGAR